MKGTFKFYQRALIAFIIFLLFAIWGFWPSYFSRLFADMNVRLHLHGIGMTLWCMMLVGQAFLAMTKRNSLHHQLGKVSYLLVPFMILSTINLLQFTLKQAQPSNITFYFAALVLNALIAFLILYGLAIKNRKNHVLHSRFMICTVLPMVTPITDRLIYRYLRPLTQYAPKIDDRVPIVPIYGFVLADLLLITLIFINWKDQNKRQPFFIALIVMVIYHFSVLNFYKYNFWQSFSKWFMSLPMI